MRGRIIGASVTIDILGFCLANISINAITVAISLAFAFNFVFATLDRTGFNTGWYAGIWGFASNVIFVSKALLFGCRVAKEWALLMIAIIAVIVFLFWNAQWRNGATCDWIVWDRASEFFFGTIEWTVSWAWVAFIISAFLVAVIIFSASFWIGTSGTQELVIFTSNLANQRTFRVGWAFATFVDTNVIGWAIDNQLVDFILLRFCSTFDFGLRITKRRLVTCCTLI